MARIAIEIPKDELRAFCRKWKVTELALFGSVTRPEEFRDDSDVDVHHYRKLEMARVWSTVEESVPELLGQIEAFMREIP